MGKFYNYLASLIFIIIGFLSILGFEVPSKISGGIKPSFEYGITSIFIGLIFLYIGYKSNEKQEKYSKCPKCKENYTYTNLKDGLCPRCNIKTIEIDEYFKKYPDELDDV